MQSGLRAWINLANGSTLAELGVAALGGARVARSADRLFTGTGYRLPLPPAPAFCLGNVIVTRLEGLDPSSALFRHEARHATHFAWCGGVVMVPLYLAAAAVPFMMACGSPRCRSAAGRASTMSVTSPLSGSMPAR